MPDATEQFFEELARRGYEPKLAPAYGTGMFDITENGSDQQWLVQIRNGNIVVSEQRSEADFVVHADRAVFNHLVSGRLNALSAMFCNALAFEGDVRLLVLFQRLFPPPDPTISRPYVDVTGPAGGDQATAIGEAMVRMLDGPTFVVCDPRGDMDASPTEPAGLFSYDTRFLSRWTLTIDGQRMSQLSIDEVNYFEHRFFLVPGAGNVNVNLSVIRQRRIGDGFCEDLVILSRNESPIDLTIRVDAASDFAHLFEVKSGRAKRGKGYARAEPGRLLLRYERETFRRETVISSDAPAEFDERGLTIKARVDPRGRWSTRLHVVPGPPVAPGLGHVPALKKRDRLDMEQEFETWLQRAPRLECDWRPLTDTYQRCLVDLAALRFSPLVAAPGSLPAAGLPWFMSMFGRDSIFTSLQALAFQPELAATTLRALAIWQGTRVDDFRDEDPGRILHELRYGELTAFEERPHSPYYGTADATPLFVILVDEYERWTGDVELVRDLEFEARAALTWIDQYADLMGNGYISYRPRNEKSGLENQCWKDSPDSISYHDGQLPGFPRATCELQGYAYDAKIRGARLAREIWNDPGYAERLTAEAAELKQRFNRDFWIDAKGYYALALDADGRQLDALSSNIGHLLWSGIVEDDRANSIARHLLGPHLFSGWGVRTLGDQEGRYNPIGYHTGTVWPFDNSIIAWGLRRYGYREEAARLAAGILDAATFFNGRLPEAFGGYERAETRYPVRYPTACSPQAWSTGAPLLFLRTMLGLDPFPDFLAVDPALPPGIGHIELLDISGRWGRVDAFGRGRGGRATPSTLRPQLGQPSDRIQR